VIVGASVAGAKAAEGLRDAGFDGAVVLIGAEAHRPYARLPLSKGYLKGTQARSELDVHSTDWYAEHGVQLRLGVAATENDMVIRVWVLNDEKYTTREGLHAGSTEAQVRAILGEPTRAVVN
jgi:3-phenylpropionate/trans-cinnamate dioxygenase ferredoxin reductase subunit